MSTHPDEDTLRTLVAGELDSALKEILLEHLAVCDSCMEIADRVWEGIPGLAQTLDVPPMDLENQRLVQMRLLHRVHLANLGTQVTWMVTEGFMGVLIVLMRPLIGRRRGIREEGAGR
jgi:hypothetical protein